MLHVSSNIYAATVLPASLFSTCVTPGVSRHPHLEGEPCICMYGIVFLRNTKLFSSGRGSFLALSAAGHAEGFACTPRRKCGSRPRGAFSGRSKSRKLASNREIAFRPARANQAHANSHMFFFLHFFTSFCCFLL